ncbi:carboxymuconolactone decarboxylase family protein [Bradyrhizobium sp. UFLA01-814]|uniref:carboxymuconolactone decarboxylase family protein n=1 Tax=Bradyrhizobium sp. UFLA01-814 TaxID=3023480 RepID=UPI00398BAAE2
MSARISPAVSPFPEKVQQKLDFRSRGERPPLVLFTTLARNERLFHMFFSGSLLDPGTTLGIRLREIVIDRVTALSGSEYEWGVHVAVFGTEAGLTEDQIVSTAKGGAADDCWSPQEKALIAACDELHISSDISDATWTELKKHFTDDQAIEILMLAGRYKVVSYLTNAIRMPLETWARRFP